MSGTTCPRCHGPIPEGVVRELTQGTKCPFCAAALKRSPGRAAIEVLPADGGYASFQATTAKPAPAKAAEPPKPVERAKPPEPPAKAAKPPEPPRPAASLASVPAQKNIRSTIVGTVAPPSPTRPLPFDGSPEPISFALSPPASPPPVRTSAAPVRAATAPVSAAPASAPPVRGGAAAAFARTIAAPAPVRTPSVRSAVAPAAGRPARSLTPAQALDLPPPTPPPELKTPPPALVTSLVTDNDSEPTHVAAASARHATPPALQLDGSDSEAIIEAVTMTAEPADPPAPPPSLMPAASPLFMQQRRNLPLIGVGMGLAIVAVVVGGIKLLNRPKASARVATVPAKPAPEPEPAAPTIEPAPPPSAPVAKVPPPPARAAKPTLARVADAMPMARATAAKPAAPIRAAHDDAPATSKRRGGGHPTKVAHQPKERHTRKVAMRGAAGKKSAAPAPSTDASDPRPHYERGNALLFAGDGKGAIAAYREAVKLAPSDPIGFRGLGLAYEQQGETAAAIRALRRYQKLAPSAPDHAIIDRRIERLSQRAKK